MPKIDLPDDELTAVIAAVRGVIHDDRYPNAPRLDPLKAALARLEAAMELKTVSHSATVSAPSGKGEKRKPR